MKTTLFPSIPSPPIARWELMLLAAAMLAALVLGSANLGAASIWHDEAVHVLVGRSIAESWAPRLPSGETYRNANLYNAILALFIACFGESEAAVRSPAVLFSVLNVLLIFCLARRLVGRGTALTAAFALALSPWSVAWAREARFYSLQQTLYLLFVWMAWEYMAARESRRVVGAGILTLTCFVAGFFVSWHSTLFATPVAALAAVELVRRRDLVSRWTLTLAVLAVLAILAWVYFSTLTFVDRNTVFVGSRFGQNINVLDARDIRGTPLFYVDWLCRNLGRGFFLLALLGTGLLLAQKRRESLYAVLCFWAPLFVLSFLIGYRRQRFMFFAYPFYGVVLSHALVYFAGVLVKPRRTWVWACAAVAILLVGLRIAQSTVSLVGASLAVARGADSTVERRHPQWREPCRYVREHLDEETVVLTTTFSPVFYYLGRVDQWFPSKAFSAEGMPLSGEARESGMAGLSGLTELKEYISRHPRGYFLAEYRRFEFEKEFFAEELAWVTENMTRVSEASSSDVTVFAWGL